MRLILDIPDSYHHGAAMLTLIGLDEKGFVSIGQMGIFDLARNHWKITEEGDWVPVDEKEEV